VAVRDNKAFAVTARPSPYIVFRETRFFGSLDGLRAISIAGVIWVHTTIVSPYYLRFSTIPILSKGGFGVDIFFSISGFLITTLLLRERDTLGNISLRNFYLRRTLRIWPLYYGTLGFYVLLVLLLQRNTARAPTFFHYLPGYLTFTYTWFAFWYASGAIFHYAWSLSVEEQFYMLWAPVMRFLSPRWPPLLVFGLILIRLSTSYGLLGCVLRVQSLPWRIGANISVSICLGVLLAYILHSKRSFQVLYPILGQKWSARAALLLMLLCLSAGPSWWLLQTATLFLLVGACVVRENNGLARLLQFRPVAYVGTVSYGMYMLNTLVIDGLHPVLARFGVRHPALTFFPFLVVTVLVASLSYRYFESPFLALKTRFVRVSSTKTPLRVPTRGGVAHHFSQVVDKVFNLSLLAFLGSRPYRQE